MKKEIYRIVLMLILPISIANPANAQDKRVAYYDAVALREIFKAGKIPPTDANVLKMLRYYIPTGDISALVQKNPYLKDYFKAGGGASLASSDAATADKAAKINAGSIGGINVSNIADGIARFLIKRGKEELNAAFFNRLKEFLEKNDECKTLFPATCEFFGNVASYRYAELIQSLRDAFYKDLSNLIIGLNQLIELPKYQKLLINLPEIRVAIRSARIISELSQSADDTPINPAILIEHLAGLSEWPEIHPNLGNAWKLLEAVSGSVRNQDDTRIWVPLSDLNVLIKDKATLDIFLGLFYEQVRDIQFISSTDTVSVKAVMDSAKAKSTVYAFTSLIENFFLIANDVDRTISDIKEKKAKGSFSNEDYYTYINKAINVAEYGFKMANVLKPGLINDRYIIIARNGNELYKNIFSKDYNSAVKSAYNILDQVFNHAQDLATEKKNRGGLSLAQQKALDSASSSPDLPQKKFIEAFLRYGNFLASVIKAESADEVEAAIEAAALPAGSYSIKQNSSFNVSLNGYIGYGWDIDEGSGVYAPVGFSISKGLGKKNGGALTLFASIIDVGSIVSYRLKNGNDDALKQEVRLESIFAPSAQLLFEIPKLPIAFGPGWRRTPKLFYSSSTDFTVVKAKSVFNFSVLIDIPIFTLTNRSYNK